MTIYTKENRRGVEALSPVSQLRGLCRSCEACVEMSTPVSQLRGLRRDVDACVEISPRPRCASSFMETCIIPAFLLSPKPVMR